MAKNDAFFKKVDQLNFSVKVSEETRATILKEVKDGKVSAEKAAPALKELEENEKNIKTEGRFIIEGGFLAGGISYGDYSILMASFL